MIMMSVQTCVCHANLAPAELSRGARQMSEQAPRLVNLTYEASNQESIDSGIMDDPTMTEHLKSDHFKQLTQDLVDTYIKIGDIKIQHKNIAYTSSSLKDLDSLLLRTEKIKIEFIDFVKDHLQKQLAFMKNPRKDLYAFLLRADTIQIDMIAFAQEHLQKQLERITNPLKEVDSFLFQVGTLQVDFIDFVKNHLPQQL